jgi:hypothetical protein
MQGQASAFLIAPHSKSESANAPSPSRVVLWLDCKTQLAESRDYELRLSFMAWIYHEKQFAAMCGQHCLNNLLQNQYFDVGHLSDIAQVAFKQLCKIFAVIWCFGLRNWMQWSAN